MFGYDHHHNPHHYGGNFHHHHARAPSPDRRLQNKHHHHPHEKAAHVVANRDKLGIKGCSSTNISMLAIDVDGAPASGKLTKNRLNASTSNISHYGSSHHLDVVVTDLTHQLKKNSLTNGLGGHPQKMFNSVQNLSRNVSASNLNELGYAARGSVSASSYQRKLTLGDRVQIFLECSKPCGYLTAVVGCMLLVTSVASFVLVYEKSLCQVTDMCDNQLMKISAVMALVFGIVFAFIGFVIVVYSKKDINAKVIITSAKQIGRIGKKELDTNGNLEAKLEKELSNLSGVSAPLKSNVSNVNKQRNDRENQKLSDPLLNQQSDNPNINN
jgi:hypothetical protein